MASKKNSEILAVNPIVPVIEIDDTDEFGEVWKTNWVEYDEILPSWRLILFSVLREDGEMEWALIRQIENNPSVQSILHMKGDRDRWPAIIKMAKEYVLMVHPKGHELDLRLSEWSDSYGIRWTGGLDDASESD